MPVLGDISPVQFLARYWQQERFVIRGSSARQELRIDSAELAGLACEDDVESRLVLFEPHSSTWTCEHGPFAESRFAALPDENWTLLVQAVDQWYPELLRLKQQFDFLPTWRLDDIMISYATPGGGVGPHFDLYDVFLLQLEGVRRWRLGQHCDDSTPLLDHDELKLLAHFEAGEDVELQAGDMLYLPPGIAHWGTATSEDCVTCSIGFRAPSYAEVFADAGSRLLTELAASDRYRDACHEVSFDPYLIGDDVTDQLYDAWLKLEPQMLRNTLIRAFASQVTEPRYPDQYTELEPSATQADDSCAGLEHSPSSRFAYRLVDEGAELYVDGEMFTTSVSFARGICHGTLVAPLSGSERLLLETLLDQGVVSRRP